ncbi:hypothetical protein [Olleya sp. ITB9]|uniref:hypothetical protein n=1 Tax=Olleya sp. ITB9 TaxID=1715648 RepID=UPI0006CF3FC0|nr:hypothetical protein [Olleya sp. ITB9]
MIVKLASPLFFDPNYFEEIDGFLKLFIENRYELLVDNPDITEKGWIEGVRPTSAIQDFIKEALVNSVNLGKEDVLLNENNDIENKVYSLKDGMIFLSGSVLIFMENANNDQKFIRGILQKIETGEKAFSFYKKRWLEFRHCGGKDDIVNQINQELRKYRNEELDNCNYLKAIVICDSDRKYPNETLELDKLINHCTDNKIKLHVLEKREIENYIPLEMLETNENIDKNKVNSLKELTPEQQDFYDLEKGFNIDSRKKLHPLFEDISNENYRHLIKGLHTTKFRTKTELPKMFLSEFLTKKMLLDKCKHQNTPKELENIIEKINDLL